MPPSKRKVIYHGSSYVVFPPAAALTAFFAADVEDSPRSVFFAAGIFC